MKKIRYLLEFLLLRLYVLICQILGPKAASDMGGWLGRTIGPLLAKSKEVDSRIHKHLDVSPEEAKNITKAGIRADIESPDGDSPVVIFIAASQEF